MGTCCVRVATLRAAALEGVPMSRRVLPVACVAFIAVLVTILGCTPSGGSQPAADEAAAVPNVVGLTQSGACSVIEKEGFATGQVTTEAAPAGGDANGRLPEPECGHPEPRRREGRPGRCRPGRGAHQRARRHRRETNLIDTRPAGCRAHHRDRHEIARQHSGCGLRPEPGPGREGRTRDAREGLHRQVAERQAKPNSGGKTTTTIAAHSAYTGR